MKRWPWCAALLVSATLMVLAGAVLAQAPATQPAPAVPGIAQSQRPFPPLQGYYPPARGEGSLPSAREWAEAERLLKQWAPYRFRAAERQVTPEAMPRWQQWVTARYRALDELRAINPELYESRLRMLRHEDEIWERAEQYRYETDPHLKSELRVELRYRISEMYEAGLRERQERLGRLQKALDRERALLESDIRDQDKIVDQKLEESLKVGGLGPPEFGASRATTTAPADRPSRRSYGPGRWGN